MVVCMPKGRRSGHISYMSDVDDIEDLGYTG
jgi:hypothetical protein